MKQMLTFAAIIFFASPMLADHTDKTIRNLGPCEWEAVFRSGTINCGPCGRTFGTVLYADGKHPRIHAHLQGTIWKGKTFHCDGTFTNRWLGGVHAISTSTYIDTSWLDGQPCLVMQYPPDAPIFGNVRDELRQICPGVWLGRSYDCVSGQTKNWFMLREK